jgi:PAS domain S-box-containing protein
MTTGHMNTAKKTGFSWDEVRGKNPRILASGKIPKTTYEDMWAHLTRGEVWQGEFINRRKDGSEFIESVLFSPVRQPDGCVTNYLAIKEDITERKQAGAGLTEKVNELLRWQEATSGRENRILELKHEINQLLGSTGQAPRYPSAETQDLAEDKS